MGNRILLSLLISAAAFILSFVAFNFIYIEWAVWRYPQTNSMAGMTAFFLGFPVGAVVAILSFCFAFH
jgi:hypothetical protein